MAVDEKADPDDVEREERHFLQALVAAGLVSEDPEVGPNLVYPLPEAAEIIRIVGGYNTNRTIGRKIRCAACPQHQHHFRGFRVELSDTRQANIGFNCGEHHFGEGAWKVALNDYEARVEAAHYNARVAPTLVLLDKILPMVDGWHERTKELAREFSHFRRSLPELHAALVRVCQYREGRLELEEQVTRAVTTKVGKEQFKRVTEVTLVGRVPFPGLFVGDGPNSSLVGAKQLIATAVTLLNGKRDTISLAKVFRDLRQARQLLREASDRHAGALSNLDPSWLPGLCKWANAHAAIPRWHETEGRSIVDDYGLKFTLPDPDELGPSPFAEIDGVWSTFGAVEVDEA